MSLALVTWRIACQRARQSFPQFPARGCVTFLGSEVFDDGGRTNATFASHLPLLNAVQPLVHRGHSDWSRWAHIQLQSKSQVKD